MLCVLYTKLFKGSEIYLQVFEYHFYKFQSFSYELIKGRRINKKGNDFKS